MSKALWSKINCCYSKVFHSETKKQQHYINIIKVVSSNIGHQIYKMYMIWLGWVLWRNHFRLFDFISFLYICNITDGRCRQLVKVSRD